MKTIAIQFRENSKIYNFNTTDESIKAGDFVLIYTQEQFKIVLVVEDNLEFEENHAQILGKLNDNLPEFENFNIFELVKYKDQIYKNIILYIRNVNKWGKLRIFNILINSENLSKDLFVAQQNKFDTLYNTVYKVIINSQNKELSCEFKEMDKDIINSYEDLKIIFDENIENQKSYVDILKNINTSFVRDEENDSFVFHPISTFIREFKENAGLKIIMQKEKVYHNYNMLEKPYIFKPEEFKNTGHYHELLAFLKKLEEVLSDKYYDSEYLQEEYYDVDDYIYEVKEDDIFFGAVGSDFFFNNFNIIAYEEVSEKEITTIKPVLKFKLVHEVDTSAVEYDLNLKFQTLDVEIENKETILKAS